MGTGDVSTGAEKGAGSAADAASTGAARGVVQVVVDDTACIAPEDAARLGITVVDLPVDEEGGEASTSAIGPLHLCAAYARALERSAGDGGDAGVVALHVGKGLSGTYSNAVTAAAVLEGVRVVDTSLVGAGMGAAAVAAAEVAHAGGDLDACVAAAESVVKRNHLWLYVPKLDALRRGGRISAGQAMLSTALSIKPVIGLQDGTLGLVAKCRTEGKVLDKLVDLASAAARGRPAQVFLHHADALDLAEELEAMLSIELADGTSYRTLPIPRALLVHTGPGAVAVAIVVDESVCDDGDDAGPGDDSASGPGESGSGGAVGAGFFGKLAKGAGGAGGGPGGAGDAGEESSGSGGPAKSAVPPVGWSSGWSPAKSGSAGAAGSTGSSGAGVGAGLSSGLGAGAKRGKALGVEPIDLSGDGSADDAAGDAVGDAAGAPGADVVAEAPAADAVGADSATGDNGLGTALPEIDDVTVVAAEDPDPVAPLFTTVTSKLPHWSENRRAAKEKAERLAKAIADLSRRDKSDPEGAAFADDAKEEAARLAAERAENGGELGGQAKSGGKTPDEVEPDGPAAEGERPTAD